jgi:hypothetical protein
MAIHSERTRFSPGFFEASAKAHNRGAALFRNAEALLPSAKAEAPTKLGAPFQILT